MNSIGETLRHERLRHNLSLEQVARETKISARFLQAIEAEDFSKLPGGVFTRSFVRQYARLLGLDEEEVAAELQRTIEPSSPLSALPTSPVSLPPQIELPRVPDWDSGRRNSGSWLPALALVVVVMLVCSAVYAWWQKERRAAANLEAAQISRVAKPPVAAVPPPIPVVQPPDTGTPGATTPEGAAPPAAPPQPAPETAERQVPAETPANPNAPVRVVLTAGETTWVSVRSDGKLVYTGTLHPNQSKGIEAKENMRVILGNAGGVNITLNGKAVPPVGPRGQVRVVQLSPGGVQIVPPKPPAAPDPL